MRRGRNPSGSVRVPCAEQARLWILAATILGSSMAFIDSTVVNVALPALQASFRATVVDVQWVVESYGLFLGAMILVGGSLGDLFGRRLVFVVGVIIFALASTGCGAASNIHQLIIARSVQGVGAALLGPGALRSLAHRSTRKAEDRPSGRGLVSRLSPRPLDRFLAAGLLSMRPGAEHSSSISLLRRQ